MKPLKTWKRAGLFVAGLTLVAGPSLAVDFYPEPHDARVGALQRAEDALMRKDLIAMTQELREVLMDPATDDGERNTAFGLLNQAYEGNGGSLPAAWQLPSGIKWLTFKQFRKEHPGEVNYSAQIDLTMDAADRVKELQLVRYPTEVVMDIAAHVGSAHVEQEDEGYGLDVSTGEGAKPLADGLYLLNLETNDGQVTKGWFIVRDLVASASPTLLAPAVGAQVASAHPEMRWVDFHTPEYKPWESRHLALHIGLPKTWQDIWSLYDSPSERTTAVVGAKDVGSPELALAPGKYWAMIGFQEERDFGPVRLRRCASTSQYFYVQQP